MSTFKKFVEAETGGTHKEADATLVDVIMPTTPLAGSTGNLARAAIYGVGGWVLATRKHTGKFGF